MGLNKQSGNMYGFITHTWNTIKGVCPHGCEYCYMKRFKNQKAVRFDEKELKTDLGKGNFIFVGSSCDMFADDIPAEWIIKTLEHCKKHEDNTYFFQSKQPRGFTSLACWMPDRIKLCTTIETNRQYKQMGIAPNPFERADTLKGLSKYVPIQVTIEPIMDFDLVPLALLISSIRPEQVNIGADSGHNRLPEPSKEKIEKLISNLEGFTKVHKKPNLKRLLK